MKRIMTILVTTVLLVGMVFGVQAWGASYNYMSPEEVKGALEAARPLILLDIQVEEGYCEHHIPGALATYAYPVKSEDDKKRLDTVLAKIASSDAPVVIVCPRGGGGAKRAYDHLRTQAVPDERLYILEKGQEGWPYPDLTEKEPR